MNTWEMKEFTAQEIHEEREKRKIVVPKYQRGIVWKENQKKELIDSIKKGIPFGSILLYEDEDNKNYRLIDGLQRCTTIYEFISNPANYYDEEDIDDNSIKELKNLTGIPANDECIRNKITEIILNWIKTEHKTMEDITRMQYYNCAIAIKREFPSLNGKEEEITNIIKPMFYKYIKICETMSKAKIPAIVIKGEDEILPIVFERINSKGCQLTKWQIYAATWSEEKVKIGKELEKIVSFNKERYETMIIDDNIELQDFNSISIEKESQVNIFELLFGFGKMISEQFPKLFATTKRVTEVDSIGFNLVNACLILKNSEIKNLNRNLREFVGNDEQINLFLQAIVECIKTVDKAIAVTTKFKSNMRDDNSPLHTEMQICSLIASVFINKYVIFNLDDNDNVVDRKIHFNSVNENWKEYKEKFLNNVLKTYVTDILQSSWKGSGDKKLNNIITNNIYYTKEVSKEEFEKVLELWFDAIKNERNEYKKIQNPKEADKVLINIIYSNQFLAKDQIDDSKYDIEHLATKEIMKKQLERFAGNLRLPISSIGNLCLLPEDYNRAKGEKTIYQYDISVISSIEEKYSFTVNDDLEWIEHFDITQEELKAKYNQFIDKRFKIMKDKIINVLF